MCEADTTFTKEEMYDYLLNTYCQDEFERTEILKWIEQKSLEYVYSLIAK